MNTVIPDYIEPLVAHRKWSVLANGLLCGIAARKPWAPKRPFKADCAASGSIKHGRVEAHWNGHTKSFVDAPVKSCACGIYAAKTADQACNEVITNDDAVWGEVWIWGRIIEHEHGYRAEYAYPKALFTHAKVEIAERVSRMYGVPCERLSPRTASQHHHMDFGVSFFQSYARSVSQMLNASFLTPLKPFTAPVRTPPPYYKPAFDWTTLYDDVMSLYPVVDTPSLVWAPSALDDPSDVVLHKPKPKWSDEKCERVYRSLLREFSTIASGRARLVVD